jgi:hypothetical protein
MGQKAYKIVTTTVLDQHSREPFCSQTAVQGGQHPCPGGRTGPFPRRPTPELALPSCVFLSDDSAPRPVEVEGVSCQVLLDTGYVIRTPYGSGPPILGCEHSEESEICRCFL